jgi:hypothetical protein
MKIGGNLQATAPQTARIGTGTARLELTEIDALTELTLSRLLARGWSAERVAMALLAYLANHKPDLPALSPILPLTLAAAGIESMLETVPDINRATDLWRIAAILAAETLVLQIHAPNGPTVTVTALWQALEKQQSPLISTQS